MQEDKLRDPLWQTGAQEAHVGDMRHVIHDYDFSAVSSRSLAEIAADQA